MRFVAGGLGSPTKASSSERPSARRHRSLALMYSVQRRIHGHCDLRKGTCWLDSAVALAPPLDSGFFWAALQRCSSAFILVSSL